jgi:hypothetical protein
MTQAGLTYQGKPRTCGLRFSLIDGVVLLVAAAASMGAYRFTYGYSLLVGFVVLHFFLFCNVFRIRRLPELVWGGTFVVNCLAWIVLGNLNLAGMCGTQALITIAVIANELRLPCYHGIFARRINPRIEEYLSG